MDSVSCSRHKEKSGGNEIPVLGLRQNQDCSVLDTKNSSGGGTKKLGRDQCCGAVAVAFGSEPEPV